MHPSPSTRSAPRSCVAFIVFVGAGLSFRPAVAQTLDLSFAPQASTEIYALAVQPDGRILIGGNFSQVSGSARSRVARLLPDGSVDPVFNPNVSSTVNAIAVQPDGRVLIGGFFNSVGAQPRARLARVNADGSLDLAFLPEVDGSVRVIVVQPDGRILIAGPFATVAGAARAGLARLHADGSLDSSFSIPIGGLAFAGTGATTSVDGLTLQADGRIFIAGNFSQVAGQARAGVARLLPDGVLDLTFTPPVFNSSCRSVLALPDGKFVVCGNFSRANATTVNFIVRLNADGSHDPALAPPFVNGSVIAAVRQPDGKILIGGFFSTVGGLGTGPLARLHEDGALDATFRSEIAGSSLTSSSQSTYVYNLAVPPGDFHVVAVGSFSTVAGLAHSSIVRYGTPLPVLTREPVSLVATPGASVTLSIASGGTDLRYQWLRNGVALPGATRSGLTLPAIQAADSGIYSVSVANRWGVSTSRPASVSIGSAVAAPTYTFTTLAGLASTPGRVDGVGTVARFDHPTGLAFDSAGNLCTLDSVSNFIRKISPAGGVITLTSQAGLALAVHAAGDLYVADGRSRVVRVAPNGVGTPFAGAASPGFADGPAATARFDAPAGVAIDRQGVLYVADTGNRVIRRISPAGEVSSVAGFVGLAGSVDGRGTSARFVSPRGLAFDLYGNLLVADGSAVRRVSPDGVVTSLLTTAGAIGLATDPAGNVYVADVSDHAVWRLAPDGTRSLLAGEPGRSGSADGPGGSARFNSPWGLALDPEGNLYVADNGNSTIRKGSPGPWPLALTLPPVATHAAAGSTATLAVGASGPGLSYQWKKDGVVLPDAVAATLEIARARPDAHMGAYSVVVSSGGSAIETPGTLLTVANPADPGRIVNVATRGFVPPGEALTPGFVLRGSGRKQFLIRGVGPTLLRFGLGGFLNDPRLELAPLGGAPLLAADDWSGAGGGLAAAAAFVGAFPLEPLSRDAAALATLATLGPSAAYTVRVAGAAATESGLALAEVYDTNPADSRIQLANVSTRGFVGTGANALVPGFVIGGGGPLHLLIRAVGPGLGPFGVAALLADPQLAVIPQGRDTPVAANDNWGGTAPLVAAFAAAGAFPLAADSRDAALLVRLPPGAYTVTVSGVGSTTGHALVEIYDLP